MKPIALLLTGGKPEQLIQKIATRVMAHLNCDVFFNFIIDRASGRLKLNAYGGIPLEMARNVGWLDLGQAICGCVARDGSRIVSENIMENGDQRADLVRSMGVKAYAANPLLAGDRTIGTLSFGTRSRTSFTDDELEFMKSIADSVSAAMYRAQVEESLRETGDYLNNLIDYANTPIIVWNPAYEITRFNHAFERITGRTSGEVIGQKLDILFPNDSRQASMAHISDATIGKRWEVVEIPIVHRDGSVRILLWNSAPIYGAGGNTVEAIVAQGQDITERKKAEAEIENLARFPSENPNAVLRTSPDGRITYANEAAGFLLQSWNRRLGDLVPEDVWRQMCGPVDGGLKSEFETEVGDRWLSLLCVPIPGEQYVNIYAMDITERKKIEQLKDEFVGMVSHELKTPITIIMGAIDTAMTVGITVDESNMLLEDAASSAESLAGIVDNLLELSRVQANRLVIRTEPLSIAQVARNVVEKLMNRSAKHRLIVDVSGKLPKVMADRVRLERILHNLVENAIKYSPRGGDVTVFAKSDHSNIVIGVKDQGEGISPEDQEKLFKPFERLEKISRVGGVGLGLNVCRRLVEAHGGRIWVESTPGQGSTFYFTLPLN